MSLRRLGLERIDLFQLHRIDAKVPAEEQFGLLADLLTRGQGAPRRPLAGHGRRDRGGRPIVPIVSVQNLYNLTDRSSEERARVTARPTDRRSSRGTRSRPGG